MSESWEAIRDGIVSTISERARVLLERNEQAKRIIVERSSRLAKLAALYAVAPPAGREAIAKDMKAVQLSIELELSAIAVDASAEAKAALTNLASGVFDTVVKTLPGILSLL